MTTPYICDFCSNPDPEWRYEAKSFVDEVSGMGSAGDWAVCEVCHGIIGLDDWESLTQRVSYTFVQRYGLPEPFAYDPAALRQWERWIGLFRQHWTGRVFSAIGELN